jgi:hypothetical protein
MKKKNCKDNNNFCNTVIYWYHINLQYYIPDSDKKESNPRLLLNQNERKILKCIKCGSMHLLLLPIMTCNTDLRNLKPIRLLEFTHFKNFSKTK